ncbi:YncE family protein [Frankia sp. AgB1.9]|uniref:YncE family protein n=1 Tax=unclassified Frankia TaxID=2632575 RepID=UPI001933E178|nr:MULTISPECIES: YncE family protein [unclassified Frankia]MBL7486902.1 YncE family protein [Frankia sp. AgW1.1]MBL7547211.1 YncE family protein [Frankia sp. AgB1.9]MBL7623997.1 YncE family protein [Frankia sp. AgB1.8]
MPSDLGNSSPFLHEKDGRRKTWARALRAVPAVALVFAVLAVPGQAEALGDPKIYVANNSGNSVSVVDAGSNTVVATIPVAEPYDIATTSSPTPRAYVTSSAGTVTVIDTTRDVIVGTIPVGGQPTGVAISNDLRRAYVTNYAAPYVTVIDTTTNSVVGTIPLGATSMDIAILDARTYHVAYVTNYEEGTLSVIDLTHNTVAGAIPVGLFPDGVAASDDLSSPRVYVANSGETTLTVLDAKLGITTVNLGTHALPRSLAIDTDAFHPRVYVAGPALQQTVFPTVTFYQDAVAVIDADTNNVVRRLDSPSATAVAISEGLASPRLYVLTSNPNVMRVFDPETGATVATVPVGAGPIALAIQS